MDLRDIALIMQQADRRIESSEKSDLEMVVSLYHEIIKLWPEYPTAYNNLSFVLSKLERFEEAIRYAKIAINIDPQNPIYYNNLGSSYNRLGDHEEAIKHLQKAIEIDSEYAEAHNNLGYAYIKFGNCQDAIIHLNQAVKITPNSDSYILLGDAYKGVGEIMSIGRCFEEILQKHISVQNQ